MKMKPNGCTSYSSSQQSSYNNGSSSCGSNRIRVIRLRRRNNVPLGFSVRGGREHGTGIFVSEVRAGSEAHHQGLLVGDQILRINGFNIEHAIHDEVLALLRAKPGVVVKVKSMGMIPVKDTKKDPLTWKIVDPGPSTPEPSGTIVEDECIETRITIPSIGSSGLGCSIVKGPPDVPGIYIQSVKAGSLAEKTGLQVGDRIIEMNGHNFTNLDFPEAVAVLKSSKQMSLVLLKCAGLHLFPEEKLRRFSGAKQEESKKLSSVQEEDARDERDAKKMNGHNTRVKSGSEFNHPNEGEVILNGNSSCSGSDVSSQQVAPDGVARSKFGNSVKVCATVHSSSSGDDELHNFINKCARESGDGMDFESLNGQRHLQRKKSAPSWDGGQYDASQPDARAAAEDYSPPPPHPSACSEEDSCSSSLSSGKEVFLNNGASEHNGLICPNRNGDKISVTSDDKSELSSVSSDDYLGVPKIATKLESMKPQNEFLKRKQHELLMEEFREVHKKMFGQGPPRLTKPPKQTNVESQDQYSPYKRRQQMRKDKTTPPPPPPPPPPDVISCRNIVNGSSISSEALSEVNDSVSYRRRQREPPITDSRDPDPKPPQTYFEKPENGLKPLVTIGTYSNAAQQNRFLNNDTCKAKITQKNGVEIDLTSKLQLFSSKVNGELSYAVHNKFSNSSASSAGTTSSSSESRSPISHSVASCDSILNPNLPPFARINSYTEDPVPTMDVSKKVPNAFQISSSQFNKLGKAIRENVDGENNKTQTSKDENKASPNGRNYNQTSKSQKKDSEIQQFLEREAEGRELKTIVLRKSGPLNFTVEGGINSDLAGKIIVSEILPGNCVTEGGSIEPGDQILMVDNTRLTGLSLTAANVALRNANSNANKEMRLVIAKAIDGSQHG